MTATGPMADMSAQANNRQVGPAPSTEGMEIDFGLILDAFRRNRYLIAAIVLASLLVGVFVLLRAERLYRTSATVQIEQQSAKVLSSDDGQPSGGSQETERFLQTQIGLLNSRAMAERVAEKLNLASKISAPPGTAPYSPKQRKDMVIQRLQSAMGVTLPRDSRVAQITVTDADPEFTAAAANAYAEQFISYNLQRRFGETSYAREFLEEELEKSKARLEASEKAVVNYARQARLVDAGTGGNGGDVRLLTSSSLVDISAALGRAKVDRIEAQKRWEQAQGTAPLNMPEVLSNPAIQNLLQQRAGALADYNRDRESFKPDYPAMQDKAAELDTLQKQAQTLAQSIRNGLRNNYQIAVQQERALAGQLDQLKSSSLQEQRDSIEYNILRREVDTNRLMYDGLLQRFKEVSAAAGVTANNISIVDRAEVPQRPFTPRVTMTLGASLASGIALALLVVGIRTKLNDVIRSPEDLAAELGLPVLGTIPTEPQGMSTHEMVEGSVLSEAFWSLRLSLERLPPEGGPNSFLFTSSRSSEGKSTTSYATARNFARSGRKTLLIDGDMRRPGIHRRLSLPNEKGLASILAGESTIKEAIQKSSSPRLDILTAGQPNRNPAELFAKPELSDLLDFAKKNYDIVIVDSAPVMMLADAVALACNVSTVIFVVEANRTQADDAKSALARLSDSNISISGAILTKYDRILSLYGY